MPIKNPKATVEQERLRLLFKQSHTASTMAIVGAVACAAVFYEARPSLAPLLWWLGVFVATGLRFLLYRRFFATAPDRRPAAYWLRQQALTAVPIGVAWGALPLLPTAGAPEYLQQLQVMVPAFILMGAITSYGVYFSQYLVLLGSTVLTVLATLLLTQGNSALAEVILYLVFAPLLAMTARRYGDSLVTSLRSGVRSEELVGELTSANADLLHQNELMSQQQDLITQEEALAQHVFRQLTLGGEHAIPGVHTWNQSMGSLSGDLIQTAIGPGGEAYVFLGDFTGHGLPAALGALPASSVFQAMAGKGLPVDVIARELNAKLRQLLPVGYFCCGVLLRLDADRRTVQVWNGGLPPILVRRHGKVGYERVASHSLPLGVVDDDDFEPGAQRCPLAPGDLLYAYSDGLTEAENIDGEMWGSERLEQLLQRGDLPTPKLPSLIETVLDHVNLAPPSDDISVVEIEATPAAATQADAA